MKKKKLIFVLSVLLILLIGWLIWDNERISITNYSVKSDKLPDAFQEYVIVQVSDLHNKSFGKNQERLIKKVESAHPNMIAITGDLIDSSHTDVNTAMDFIKEAVKIAPCYYVTGNHEAWTNIYSTELKSQLEKCGVTILDNKSISISKNGQSITLAGLSDPDFEETTTDEKNLVDGQLTQMDTKGFSILLSHRPELFPVYVRHSFSLILTGHAHGGQVRLPFIGGIVAPNQGFFPKYTEGIFEYENTKMIISRGLGNSIIPIRVNDCPELVVVTLYQK